MGVEITTSQSRQWLRGTHAWSPHCSCTGVSIHLYINEGVTGRCPSNLEMRLWVESKVTHQARKVWAGWGGSISSKVAGLGTSHSRRKPTRTDQNRLSVVRKAQPGLIPGAVACWRNTGIRRRWPCHSQEAPGHKHLAVFAQGREIESQAHPSGGGWLTSQSTG
jgi:hypothetical protein